MPDDIPVIDLFAGPGGLGEGFSAFTCEGRSPFRIALSVEMDEVAHRTLELRAFFRQFPKGEAPDEYYEHVRNPRVVTRSDLFNAWREESDRAQEEAWNAELGKVCTDLLDERIVKSLRNANRWLLIGGPPCQAYSLVGRARRGGIKSDDPRVHLYHEYLRILAVHQPPVFVMENVKGLLSSKLKGESIFDRMLADLSQPGLALANNLKSRSNVKYRILSMVNDSLYADGGCKPRDYVISCERYGIPQARHRVVLLGIRSDVELAGSVRLTRSGPVTAGQGLSGLPRLRSGISKQQDSTHEWKEVIDWARSSPWLSELWRHEEAALPAAIEHNLSKLTAIRKGRGSEFIPAEVTCAIDSDWYCDPRLGGVLNHSTRSHIAEDLHRYFFAATFATVMKRSPTLKDFPPSLLPNHQNVSSGVSAGRFSDRFRVQLKNRPSTTITSHISKDGHYYIHYDPLQCRSLTVREAARLQTFPDNYFFCGPRTQQYHQVGNAVPPRLAYQIAEIVSRIM